MNTGVFFILVCLWILQGCWVLCKKDYYKILGINKKATEKDIKKAFRKLAIRYHPDKNTSPDAEDKFKEIAESYEVLSNPEKRQQYDSEGEQFHFSGHATDHHFNFDDIVHMFDEDLMTGFGHKFGDFGGIHGSHHRYSAHANHKMNEFDIDDFFPRDFGQGDFFKFHTQDDLNMGDSFFGAHASAFSSWNKDGFSGTAETSTHRGGHGHHKSCKTVTRREGNMVSTHTTCS